MYAHAREAEFVERASVGLRWWPAADYTEATMDDETHTFEPDLMAVLPRRDDIILEIAGTLQRGFCAGGCREVGKEERDAGYHPGWQRRANAGTSAP